MTERTPRRASLAALALVAAALSTAACEDPDTFLDGSLGSIYDLSFDSVEVTQFIQSQALHIEYLRGEGTGEQKPLMITINDTPEGPGSYVHNDNCTIAITNRILSSAQLPPMSSAEVVIDAFTPGEVGSEVQGSIHAMFTNTTGGGDAFSLEGAFKATLLVNP